ncbi:MAG: GFA family protein [Gammaproteobacteria bacterium]|nr:GFA family protein [Gammaproteobacteria bacterium]
MRCHCGAVALEAVGRIDTLTSCNCSICQRYGALWAYFEPEQVKVKGSEVLSGYIWGDREIAFKHCKRCGCVTHWTSLAGQAHHLVGLNMRMADPEEIGDLAVK